jgi:hypothetical protein
MERPLVAKSTAIDTAQRLRPVRSTESYVPSQLIPGDIKRAVKDAQDVDVLIVGDEVGDSVVFVEQYPDVALRGRISLANLRKSCEVLRSVVDALNSPSSCGRIIGSDVLVNIL